MAMNLKALQCGKDLDGREKRGKLSYQKNCPSEYHTTWEFKTFMLEEQ